MTADGRDKIPELDPSAPESSVVSRVYALLWALEQCLPCKPLPHMVGTGNCELGPHPSGLWADRPLHGQGRGLTMSLYWFG